MCNTRLQVHPAARNTGVEQLISTLATEGSAPKLFFGGLGLFSVVLNAICASIWKESTGEKRRPSLTAGGTAEMCLGMTMTPAVAGAGTCGGRAGVGDDAGASPSTQLQHTFSVQIP